MPETPAAVLTIREQLMASPDPDFWVRTWMTHRQPAELSDPALMRPWFANAIECGRIDGQQNPGGHRPAEVQQAIIDLLTEAFTASGLADAEGGPSFAEFADKATPAAKRFMAFVTGRRLAQDPDAPPPVFDQDQQ